MRSEPSTHNSKPTSGPAWAKSYRAQLRITDTAIVIAVGVTVIFAQLAFGVSTAVAFSTDRWAFAALTVAVWLVMLAVLQTRDHLITGAGAMEYKRVLSACTATIGIVAVLCLVTEPDFPRQSFILVMPLGVLALLVSRWLWRKWLVRQCDAGHWLSRVIVVGALTDVDYVVSRINLKLSTVRTVVGVVLDGRALVAVPDSLRGYPVYSGIERAASAAAELEADAVILASQPSRGSDYIKKLAWQLEGTATELILASRLADISGPRIRFRPVEGLPLIHVEIPQFDGAKHALKRGVDIVGASLGLLLLLPLMVVLGIIIRVDSPGGALFVQERVGRNGTRFRLLKLRTMVANAPDEHPDPEARNDGAGVLFKLKDDPRVTRVGRVLRKYSLDELPQLWNVLVGDMSLVGPRPPLPREVLGYENHVHRRLFIKPGLTGMWQVGGRSDLGWEESVRLDLYYVENWSLIGDLIIIWRTFKVLLHPVGAY